MEIFTVIASVIGLLGLGFQIGWSVGRAFKE